MLRITTKAETDRVVLKVEGKLTHPWVREADASWRTMLATADGRAIAVDLCDVYAIDDAGRELILRMHVAGVELRAQGCVMGEIVREIIESRHSAIRR
jgi:hypothetical protein